MSQGDDIRAPFTPEQVERLNRRQFDSPCHVYTCGGDRTDERHLDGEGVLMATTEGWKCPYCAYRQATAPASWVGDPLPPHPGSMADDLWGKEARADPAQPERLLAKFRDERGHRLSGRFRGIILRFIAEARSPKALELLAEQLESPDPWLRYWATKGLEWLGTPEARDVLQAGGPVESVVPDLTIDGSAEGG